MKSSWTVSAALLALAASAEGQQVRVRVTAENLTPRQSVFLTPVWFGFHDGTFDLYDRGAPADALIPDQALERLAEDGTTSVLSQQFQLSGKGAVDGALFGPGGPFAPGQLGGQSVLLDRSDRRSRYFSYASMVIPSNDAFVANGDPLEIKVFADDGMFLGPVEFALPALDAGTEVNTELPEHTAFFGQMNPDTGIDENGVVLEHVGFLPPGSGGILDDARFFEGDFTVPGHPLLKLRLEGAPAITEFRTHIATLAGIFEAPPVDTPAFGFGVVVLDGDGTRLKSFFKLYNLKNVVAAHLHLGAEGENGPIVSTLYHAAPGGGPLHFLFSDIDASRLEGPMEGKPLDALSALLATDSVYLNIHTDDGVGDQNTGPGDYASGEIRGQVLFLN